MFGWTPLQRNAAIASFLSWALDAFDFFILVFLLSELAHAFSVNIEQVTLAILLTLAVRPIGALLLGRLAEKFGRKPILMLNIVMFSLFELLSASAPNITVFLLLRVLYGVAMGGDLGGSIVTGDGDHSRPFAWADVRYFPGGIPFWLFTGCGRLRAVV